MKKLLALTLALIMVLALTACGNNDTPGNDDPLNRDPGTSQTDNQDGSQGGENNPSTQGGTPSVDVGDIDFGSMMGGNGATDVVYSELDEATKQQIIDEAKKDGVDVSFGADGSMTVVDTDGTTVVQKPDGTWVVRDEDGGEGQIGGDWPDNEYTKIVPKPDFELTAARVDDEGFVVAFQSATLDQIKDYITKIKAAGFTLNEELTDENVMGYQMYTFYAENSTGYSVEITSAMGTTGMTISKIN